MRYYLDIKKSYLSITGQIAFLYKYFHVSRKALCKKTLPAVCHGANVPRLYRVDDFLANAHIIVPLILNGTDSLSL